MSLPVGVITRTVTIAVPVDALGGAAKAFSGSLQIDRPLIWAATGEPIWPVPAALPAPVDGLVSFEAPVTDQPGMLDASGAPITGWSLKVNTTATWSGDRRTASKRFQVLTADVSPVSLDVLLGAGLTPPVSDPNPYVKSLGGASGIVTNEQLADAVGPRLSTWPIYAYGNSYAVKVATGWFTVGKHYLELASARLNGGSTTSYAVAGRRILDVCATLINGTALPGTNGIVAAGEWPGTSARAGLVVLESIVNDIAHYPTMLAPVPAVITSANTRYLDGLRAMYRTALAIMSSESRISQAAATRNGTWDAADIPTGSASGDSLSYTSSVGAGLTFTGVTPPQSGPLAGRVHFLSYALDPAIGANSVATVQITVDGGAPTTFTMPVWEQYTGHDGGATYQAPVMIPVDIPVDGAAHTVKFAHAGVAGTFFYADDLFVPSADPNPIAVMGGEHPLTGFTAPGLAAYNANRKRVADVVKAVTAEFGNAFYVPSTMTTGGLYSGDGLHPNDRGMAQRASDLFNAALAIKPRLDSRAQALRPNADFAVL